MPYICGGTVVQYIIVRYHVVDCVFKRFIVVPGLLTVQITTRLKLLSHPRTQRDQCRINVSALVHVTFVGPWKKIFHRERRNAVS